MMNYTQVIDRIEQLKIGKKDVDFKKLIQFYKEVTEKYNCVPEEKIIWIDNTYLEEATGEYLEAILKAHSYRVGRFTTYAIKKYIGTTFFAGKSISQKDFAGYGERILKILDSKEIALEFSRIEVCALISLAYFAEKNCDFLILPCGKENKEGASDDCVRTVNKRSLQAQSFLSEEFGELELSRGSYYEPINFDNAIKLLKEKNICLEEKLLKKAVSRLKTNGRFEILKSKPYFIMDGAEDASSVRVLMANLQYFFPENPYVFIVGVCNKNYEELVRESAYMPCHILTVTVPDMPNSLPAVELAKEYGKLNPNITSASSVEEAVEIAAILAQKNTVVTAFGTTALLEKIKSVVIK